MTMRKNGFRNRLALLMGLSMTLCGFNLYANCSPHHIRDLTEGRQLTDTYYVDTIREGEITICRYTLRDTINERQPHYYVYRLIDDAQPRGKKRVYCGYTYRLPRARAMEHSNPRGGEYKKFTRMIVLGNLSSEEAARLKELDCVCLDNNPKYNQRPTCPIGGKRKGKSRR